MFKKLIFTILLILSATFSYSQYVNDALKFSSQNTFGTSKFNSMSGAFGSLGGDFSNLSHNPAGLGMYQFSEFTYTNSFGRNIVTSDLGLTFINAIKPVSYKFKTGTRTHYGVIAQDLETVLDGKDFAGLVKDTETNNYGIRYTELIAPLIKALQEAQIRIETLETKVAALEAA